MTTKTEVKPTMADIENILTRHGRCCDLYQDSLGGFHCHECGQVTFAIVGELQGLFGISKSGSPLSPEEHTERRNAAIKRNSEREHLKEINAELLEAIEPLIDIAESYAMQTYDRHGVTRKKIEAAKAAIAKAEVK